MIYTVTFNPAVDLVIKSKNKIILGNLNRVDEQNMFAGGKGINVSRMLNILGRESVATGFSGGFTGKYIDESLNDLDIKTDFINIDSNTRINIKLLGKPETEINGPAPKLNNKNFTDLINKFSKFKKGDLVIISGAIPVTLPINIFEKLLKTLHNNSVDFVLDTNGNPLIKSLKYHPFLIKPNKKELEDVFNTKIKTEKEIINYAKELIKKGAYNVIVSLGKDGAIFINSKEIYKVKAIKGKVINTVGSGDSTVAGFIDEYLKSKDYNKALKKGVLVGSATAFSTDLANKKLINQLIKEVKL